MDDYAPIGVIVGIKNQCLQRTVGTSDGRRDPFYDGFKKFVNTGPCFRGYRYCYFRIKPEVVFNLFLYSRNVGGGQINLVYDGEYFKVMFKGQIHV